MPPLIDHSNLPESTQALLVATAAMTKIEDHEITCAQRWSRVWNLLLAIGGGMVSVIGMMAWFIMTNMKVIA